MHYTATVPVYIEQDHKQSQNMLSAHHIYLFSGKHSPLLIVNLLLVQEHEHISKACKGSDSSVITPQTDAHLQKQQEANDWIRTFLF